MSASGRDDHWFFAPPWHSARAYRCKAALHRGYSPRELNPLEADGRALSDDQTGVTAVYPRSHIDGRPFGPICSNTNAACPSSAARARVASPAAQTYFPRRNRHKARNQTESHRGDLNADGCDDAHSGLRIIVSSIPRATSSGYRYPCNPHGKWPQSLPRSPLRGESSAFASVSCFFFFFSVFRWVIKARQFVDGAGFRVSILS